MKNPDELSYRIQWNQISQEYIHQLISLAYNEDIAGYGLQIPPSKATDVTTDLMPQGTPGKADLVARKEMVVCGLPLLEPILNHYGENCKSHLLVEDGTKVKAGTHIATIEGPATTLLKAERVMLNFLQKLSGVASCTFAHVEALGASTTRLLDTRKTTPGYRVLEKYAVGCGKGWNHRMGLFDRVMLKDNHLVVAGATGGNALTQAVEKAKKEQPGLAIEVEVDHMEQIEPVLAAGADIIMLDNFSIEDTRKAVKLISGRALTEGSGNISLETLPQLGQLGLDFISSGAVIHQSKWIDIGLDWK
jgi:nicotinate-nucleotide pyrophosphorylase (carboxylating)